MKKHTFSDKFTFISNNIILTYGEKMKVIQIVFLFMGLFLLNVDSANAKASTVDLFTNAVMTGDAAELEKLLAPNFWYIGANGHIRDKDHFIAEIRDKKLIVNRLSLSNIRETQVGDTTMLTSNGTFQGKTDMPLPDGLMRYTTVLVENQGKEQVALFQATPVIPTKDCEDGNCRIR